MFESSLLVRLCLALCFASSVAFHIPSTLPSPFFTKTIARSRHGPFGITPHRSKKLATTIRGARGRHTQVPNMLKMKGGLDDMSPEEGMIERLVEKLESSLDSAITKEYFKDAATLRNELSSMHMDETSAVLRTNSDFYKAFSTKDIGLMGNVWLNNEQVQCIHPGAKPLVGYDNIISMWTNMFQAKDKVFRSTDIRPDHIKIHVRGTSAYVMCNEEVSTPGASRKMVATNIYRKYAGRWYMVHHHASQALRGTVPGGIEELLQGMSGAPRVIRIDGNIRDEDGSPQDVVDEIVKAIQGALGESEDIKKIDDNDQEISIRFNNGEGSSILSGRMIDIDDEEESDDDDEDSDDGTGLVLPSQGGGPTSFEDAFVSNEKELSEGVTERTVEAIRNLAKKGRISREHKRRLMTDIIEHHQAGESASSIEIAYELLVMRFLRPGSTNFVREEELLEDFSDQCIAIARRLE